MIFNYVGGGSKAPTLKFSTPYGTAPDGQAATFDEPAAPTQAGYEFLGWFADAGLAKPFDWAGEAKAATAYAKWAIAAPTVSPAGPSTYDGTAKALGTVTAKGAGQTVSYSLDGSTWTPTAPTATDAGSYTVRWRVEADHCDALTGQFDVAIAKARRTVTVASTPQVARSLGYEATVEVRWDGDGEATAATNAPGWAEASMDGGELTLRWVGGIPRLEDAPGGLPGNILPGTTVSYAAMNQFTVTVSVPETANWLAGSSDATAFANHTPAIVPFGTGAPAQLADMVYCADRGIIDLSDTWHVGDTRRERLSGDGAASWQDVDLVIVHEGGFALGEPVACGRAKCSLVIGTVSCVSPKYPFNLGGTNAGGWDKSTLRQWCNGGLHAALPEWLRSSMKEFATVAAAGDGTGAKTTRDLVSVPAAYEVFGKTDYANASVEGALTQLEWYRDAANRVKAASAADSSALGWWTRSIDNTRSKEAVTVWSTGTEGHMDVLTERGVAPIVCV